MPDMKSQSTRSILKLFLIFIFLFAIISLVTSQIHITKLTTLAEWGNPAKDMFPAISKPKYVSATQAQKFMRASDLVYVYNAEKTVFVYPARVLSYHHIVNDNIQNRPVAITLCTLSDSGVVYSRNVAGQTLELGVLGPLYNGNLVMYDKKTDSHWLQFSGQSYSGDFKNQQLTYISPLKLQKWDEIKMDSSVKVLSPIMEDSFYKDFYTRMSKSHIGLNAVKKYDASHNAFSKGVALSLFGFNFFLPQGSQAAQVATTFHLNYVPVYWYTWSAFFSRG
jgi:hypothetical protein